MSHISFVLLPLYYRYWMHEARSQNTFLIIFHINEKNGWTLYMLVAVNILLNLSCCHIPCKTICPTIKLYLTITRHLQKQKNMRFTYISHFVSTVVWELYLKPFSISQFPVHHLADTVQKINIITYMLYSQQYSPISIIWIDWAIKGCCIFLQCFQKGLYKLTRKYK